MHDIADRSAVKVLGERLEFERLPPAGRRRRPTQMLGCTAETLKLTRANEKLQGLEVLPINKNTQTFGCTFSGS
jgi:hypothetical protein